MEITGKIISMSSVSKGVDHLGLPIKKRTIIVRDTTAKNYVTDLFLLRCEGGVVDCLQDLEREDESMYFDGSKKTFRFRVSSFVDGNKQIHKLKSFKEVRQ